MQNDLYILVGAISVILAISIFFFFKNKKPPTSSQTFEPLKKIQEASTISDAVPVKAKSTISKSISKWMDLIRKSDFEKEHWEEVLIGSDLGPKLTSQLIEGLSEHKNDAISYLRTTLQDWLQGSDDLHKPWETHRPWTLFVVGVNGVGKTTSIVKLTHYLKGLGLKVGVVGADTFRKAALEQLQRGVERVGGDFFSIAGKDDASEGADPSAVIFDGLKKFHDRDAIIVDTSGRLHTKKNLLEELKKMKRVAEKASPGAPNDVWMVVDSTLGQNSVAQGRTFHDEVGLTGIILTKVDGLSRGGTLFQIYQELKVPLRFVGFGEKETDFEVFSRHKFVQDLFES